MHRREFLKAAALAAAACTFPREILAQVPADKPHRLPNIIFILSDDVGLGNIGCYGSDHFKTPNIDALAKSGIRFTHCFSQPLCGPSRAECLSGRYAFRTGMISNGSGHVLDPANEVFVPRVLKPAGYASVQVGKWSQLPLQPGDWGFDEYLRIAGSGKYWSHQGVGLIENGKQRTLPADKYLPDVMHEFLVDFVSRHKDQPFFAYYSMSHIHGPILRTPDSAPGSKNFYADNVAYMDKLVGKLVTELERMKLRKNTLIVFVGDNGTARFGSEVDTINGREISGAKGSLLEGGSRVPMIASWPGTTPRGKVNNDLIDFSDFLPTWAALAGAKLPEGVIIDGRSFAPQVKGKTGTPREWVYVELGGRWYARSAKWKLTGKGELFDMKDAPFVEAPVAADSTSHDATAGRKQLQAVLDKLNPAAGKQGAREGDSERKARKASRRAGRKGQTTGTLEQEKAAKKAKQEKQSDGSRVEKKAKREARQSRREALKATQ